MSDNAAASIRALLRFVSPARAHELIDLAAFGELKSRRGGVPASRRNAIAERNRTLKELGRQLDPALTPEGRAREVERRVERYLASGARSLPSTDPKRPLLQQLDDLAKTGVKMPRLRRLKAILSGD